MIPVVRSSGSAVPVTGMARFPIAVEKSTSINRGMALVMTNTGSGSIIAARLTSRDGNGPQVHTAHMPLLMDTAAQGGATAGRAMKAGVTLINMTAAQARGGVVYVLNTDQRIQMDAPVSTTGTVGQQSWALVLAKVRGHPDTVVYGADHFKEIREFHCGVVDAISYESFRPWQGSDPNIGDSSPQGIDSFFSHITISSVDPTPRPMSTLFIIFDNTDSGQDYMASCRGSYYTRWPLDTLAGQLSSELPTASAKVVDETHKNSKADSSSKGGNRR
jgi:hypothetical protein